MMKKQNLNRFMKTYQTSQNNHQKKISFSLVAQLVNNLPAMWETWV